MRVRLWKNVIKRNNSTKRPLFDDGRILDNVYLKENTSLENPVFIIDRLALNDETSQDDWLHEYNYMYTNNHYYFIDDIIFVNNAVVEIPCRQDQLATWKDYISNYETMIERCASEYDPMLKDNFILPKANIQQTRRGDTSIGVSGSTFVVRACFNGGLKGYAMSEAQMNDFVNYLVTRPDITDLMDNSSTSLGKALLDTATDISSAQGGNLAQSLEAKVQAITAVSNYNPADYVKSVMYFPMSLPSINDVVPIGVSGGITDFRAYPRLTSDGRTSTFTLSIPDGYYGDFRDYDSAYTKANIFLPGVGTVGIDPGIIRNGLSAKVDIDYISGGILYKIISGSEIILSASGQIGVEVQFGGSTPNYAGSIAENGRHSWAQLTNLVSIVRSIPSTARGNISGLTESLKSFGEENFNHTLNMGLVQSAPNQSIIGGVGNAAAVRYNTNIQVSLEQVASTDNANGVLGRPLYKNRKIGDLSGFVKCLNPSIQIPGFADDKEAVNTYLRSGFYYE